MTGCICHEDLGAYCTQFTPDKCQFGSAGSMPVSARSRWFNQLFTTPHWTEEGSAVWPNLSVCQKRKFLLQLEFISLVFQGRFQLHSCLAGMGIWDRVGCHRWARVGQESLEWRSLLKNKWHHFILLPPGRSKYWSVITSHKSPSRCHRTKVLCSGYTCWSRCHQREHSVLTSGILPERPTFQRSGSMVSLPPPIAQLFFCSSVKGCV